MEEGGCFSFVAKTLSDRTEVVFPTNPTQIKGKTQQFSLAAIVEHPPAGGGIEALRPVSMMMTINNGDALGTLPSLQLSPLSNLLQ